MASITGTNTPDTLIGDTEADSIRGLDGNDSLVGGAGNDTVDGGSGYNTYRVIGSADAYSWTVNASGDVVLTDTVTDAADTVDGGDEGVDVLRNIQAIQYVRPDGSIESTVQLDDYGNAPDAGNTAIQYGEWFSGRANFYGDLDYFKLQTTAGQKVVLSGGSGEGYLASASNSYGIQGINNTYLYSGYTQTLTWTTTALEDVVWRDLGLSSSSPMASRGYSFIVRRELDGTDGADTLDAGSDYEYLVGGVGNDTLNGSVRSDYLDGGAGNDQFTGGRGNDQLLGGGGTANVAVFSGNKADYSATWLGNGNLDLRLSDNVTGRDGTDTLTGIQILRFADGDVVLDAEPNESSSVGAVNIGQTLTGSLPVTGGWTEADVDYFQQKFTADISTSTTLRLSVETRTGTSAYSGYLYIQFFAAGSSEALTFRNVSGSGDISQFDFSSYPGTQRSWILSPKFWGSNTDFLNMAQRADVKVWGVAYNTTAAVGELAPYTLRLDRVLYGTTGADTLTGDGVSGYIDLRDGNDSFAGSALAEQIIGGSGDDTLNGGAGDDTLTDASGLNSLAGGEGDDLIDVSASATPTATIDGGNGTDTLKIANATDWAGLSVSGMEVLDGSGGYTSLSPQQVVAKGFTTAQNLSFRLAPTLASGGTLDASSLSGHFNLRGSNQSDTLIGNAGNNTIYLSSDTAGGAGLAADTVVAGDGDDRIVLQTQGWRSWNEFFSAVDRTTQTYALQASLDGGAGSDRLELDFSDVYYARHAWGGYFYASPWKLDLSAVVLHGVENLSVTNNSGSPNASPSELILTAAQLAALTTTSGLPAVAVIGGGTLSLSHLAALGINTWRIADAEPYNISGTEAADTVSVGAGSTTVQMGSGNDEIVINSKPKVTDNLDGGAGNDTLTLRGTDIDLSGATVTDIESIRVSSQSLSMTAAQWNSLGNLVTRATGATTGYILSVTTAGTTTLAADSAYMGLTGSTGDDRLIGNAADNILVGDNGNDELQGNAGNDRLVSGIGVDTLSGGEGNDTLDVTGKPWVRDQLAGGAGLDTLVVSDGQDLTAATLSDLEVLSGVGTVTLSAAQLEGFRSINGLSVQLAGTSSSFTLGSNTRLTNNARILLPTVDTTLTATAGILGSRGDDTLAGNAGNDMLYGGRGLDSLDGGSGDDTLFGGSGVDTLVGGAGNDRFEVQASEFTGNWQTMHSDRIDGGEGEDTLAIDFGGRDAIYRNTYAIEPGSVSNIENLVITGSLYSYLSLSADQWNRLTGFSATHSISDYPGSWLSVTVNGSGGDLDLDAIRADSQISSINLTGSYAHIDASHFSTDLTVNQLDSILLSPGNDTLRITGDQAYSVDGGAGNDRIYVTGVNTLTATTIEGGSGNDTLDVSGTGFIDLTGLTLNNVESLYYGSSTVLVTANQLATWSFDGAGAKYTKVGNTVVGTSGNDTYSGDGSGSFQGGRGNDAILNVDTAVFTGNYADYDFTRSGSVLTIQQSRGSLADGTDTVQAVMKLKFADTTQIIDDAPDSWSLFTSSPNFSTLTAATYGKHISAKKDYPADSDVFASTLAPNSPLAIAASSTTGSGWNMYFLDVATQQQISFKSLVDGYEYGRYENWMSADRKWLPGYSTADGFVAYQGGDVVFRVNLDGTTITDYALTLNFLDDYAGSADTTGVMNAQVGVVKGYIGETGDADWVRTQLIAGTKYEFHLNGASSDGGTLVDPKLQLLDSAGRLVEAGFDTAPAAVGNDDALVFRPVTTGIYYLAVSDVANINTGSWKLTQNSLDTIAGNISTTERIDWGGANTFSVSSEINALSDHDWFRIWLDKGITYDLRARVASGAGTLADPQLTLRSVTGILLTQDDNSGGSTDARITYSATDSGWYYLDAGASGNAGKGTYQLQGSMLADDYSNDRATTGLIQTAGAAVQGLVSYNGDSDWFRVGLSRGHTYVIDLTGDVSDTAPLDPLIDPLLIVHDADGDVLFKADDFAGSLNARAYFTPTTDGLYYLEAKSAFKYDIGAYQLRVSQAPADDFADTLAEASSLTLGTAQNGTIGVPGDRDLFKLELTAGRVYQVGVAGLSGHVGTLADTYLRVFDSAGHLIDFDNNGGAGNDAQLYLAPASNGTYYLEASASKDRGMGTYQISVAQHDLPPDDVPNDLSSNVSLTPGDSFVGNLLTHNDQDWFRISLEASKNYVFRVQASSSGQGSLVDPVLEIRAGDGTLVQAADNTLISNDPATSFVPATNGSYYLVVKAANGQTDTGSYTLVTRAPDDYSNTLPGATTLTVDTPLTGAIQWADGAYGVRAIDSTGLATDSDEDWFKFTASLNQVLSVNVSVAQESTLSRPMVEVVDGAGHSLAVGDGLETLNGLAVATFKAAAAGTYYARVIDGAGATGAYQVSLAAGDASDEDTAGAVALNFVSSGAVTKAETQARIGLSGDSDQFSVTLQSGHSYRIETLPMRDGIHAPLASASLQLAWQAQGAASAETVAVIHDVATPSFFDTSDFTATLSGTMRITVQPLETTHTGQYKLRVVDLGTQQDDDRPDRVNEYVDATDGVLAINENRAGSLDSTADTDLYAVNLSTGNIYDFSLKGYVDGLGTLAQGGLRLLDSNGQLVTSGHYDRVSGRTDLSVSVFSAGRYYLAVTAENLPGNTGTYLLDTRLGGSNNSVPASDITADTRSGVTINLGQPVSGRVDYAGDHDWMHASLTAGKVYVIDALANGNGAGGSLQDASLRLLDVDGNELAQDDNSGAGLDARIQFTPDHTGDYYLDVGGNNDTTGSYTLRLRELYSGTADPLKAAQWYLPAIGLDVLKGQMTGAGVKVGVVDDGIDTSHPDLQHQLDFSQNYDTQFDTADGSPKYPILIGPPDNHGTLVAGIIAAEANNETGIVGVAPDAELVSTRVKWSWDQITQALDLQSHFDVSNNSWGAISPFSDNFNNTNLTFAYQALRKGVEDGRSGQGTVFVFAAGNSAGSGDNTNYHNFQSAREVIAVGAAQSDHNMAGFSTPGATVLVSTYGADMITTDRHQAGWGENPAGNYTSFSGTSAAAPMVSGVVALMLEANPGLGYRDIQKILAYSATHPVEQDWKINAAFDCNLGGLAYNDQAGFGLVDAYAAVCLADTWQESNTALNEVSDSARAFGLNQAIPDGNEVGWTRSFTIDNAMRVEHLELGVDLRHTRLGDLIIEITSPQGTVSRVLDRPTVNAEQPFGLSGTDSGMPTHLLWDFASTQFWGEEAVGQWAVTIRDVRAEETGTLSSLSLRVYGEREDGNDTYVFTEEGFQSQATRELTDESGTDTLNASPLLHDLWVDLQSGGQIAAEGVSYPIAAWTSIENAIAGSGNDRLQGNDLANKLEGRDGADTLTGGLGNDTLDGGNGSDTARYAGNRDEFAVSFDAASKTVTVRDNRSTGGDEGIDTLKNIERLVFNDAEMSLGTLSGNHAPVANTSFFSTPVQVATTTGLDFVLPARAFSDADSTDISKNSPPVIQVSAAAGGDLPGWLSFDAATHKFTGIPPADLRGRINVQVRAVDDFGDSASDTLTLQFGDNQAPVLDDPSEKIILEDAGRVALNITAPHDPEGKTVSVRVLEVPTQGIVLDGAGNTVTVNAVLTADGLSQLHYQTTADVNGDMGYLRYQVTDADNVTADSSVHLFIDAINDAPRFANNGSGLVIQYPTQSTVTLEMLAPSDPESTLSSVKITELPALGVVKLNNTTVRLDDSLTLEQLSQLTFTLSENVNGPIGAVTIEARDPQGLATRWSLALQVQGAAASSVGTTGADSLYGSIGADTLQGMAGDDLLVGNAGDDRLLGGLGNDSLFGGSGADTLDGSSGNDYLDGGTGNDIMLGGPGNDTYVVDSSNDVVMEVISSGAGGKDLISTSVTLTAPANIEMLQAVAGYAIDLTGQSLNNTLVGNDAANNLSGSAGRDTLLGGGGNDTLDGGTGVDRMAGGTGDDLYRVDSRSDSIVELTGEGTDTVRANTSYTLTSNIENLILEGTDNYTAGGNSLDNRLVGNSGNNILAGGLGSDTLEGGAGNDIYVLNDSHDTLIDTAGNDTIRSSLDVVLPEGIENAELVGLADTTATGNAANNLLVGNMGDNILEGAGGADTLTGGDGSDQFLVSYNGLGVVPDTITDFMAGIDLLILDISSLNLPPEQLAQFSSGTVDSGSWVKGAGATAIDQNDYFLLDTATGVLKLDVDGVGAAIPLPLVSFVGHVDTNFSGTDIYLGI